MKLSGISKLITLNLVGSIILILFSGMILDGGILLSICLTGIVMFWLSLMAIGIPRYLRHVSISKAEMSFLRIGIFVFTAISGISNYILVALDWTPGWAVLLSRTCG